MSNKISHLGTIKSIADGCIKVQIVQTSACAACKIAAHCNASESKVKIVDVLCSNTTDYTIGQQVTVWASKDVANRALLLGFGVPFLLLVSVLMIYNSNIINFLQFTIFYILNLATFCI